MNRDLWLTVAALAAAILLAGCVVEWIYMEKLRDAVGLHPAVALALILWFNRESFL